MYGCKSPPFGRNALLDANQFERDACIFLMAHMHTYFFFFFCMHTNLQPCRSGRYKDASRQRFPFCVGQARQTSTSKIWIIFFRS